MRPKQIDRQLVANTYGELKRVALTAKALNINEKSVRNILKELHIPTTPRNQRNRKYYVDDNFFEVIDNDIKAYVLGFIWGDGNIQKRKNNTQLRIELAIKDQYILNNIKQIMKSTHPIYNRKRKVKNKEHISAILSISRKKIVDDLIGLGLSENKNKNPSLPKINTIFWPAFILGLSDSDGFIGIDTENRARWSIITTTSLCSAIKNNLENKNIFSRIIQTKYTNLSIVVITKKSEIMKLRDLLYGKDIPCLIRKKQLFSRVRYKKEV